MRPLPLPLEGLLSLVGGAEEKGEDGTMYDMDGVPLKTPRAILHRHPSDQAGGRGGGGGGGGGGGRGGGAAAGGGGGDADGEGKDDGEGGAFVLEGGHDRLASGGGIRGIRFLRNSQRA